jgi:hypothetical protein
LHYLGRARTRDTRRNQRQISKKWRKGSFSHFSDFIFSQTTIKNADMATAEQIFLIDSAIKEYGLKIYLKKK